jgi:hypothetical protein
VDPKNKQSHIFNAYVSYGYWKKKKKTNTFLDTQTSDGGVLFSFPSFKPETSVAQADLELTR